MRPYRPTSILQLTLVGFCVVALPLIFALASALLSVDHLARQSRQTAFDATHALHAGRTLVEELEEMERHARQFQVLKDPVLNTLYVKGHETFTAATIELSVLGLEAEQQPLAALITGEQQIFEVLSREPSNREEVEPALERFPPLTVRAKSLVSGITDLIGREADNMQDQAATSQQILIWQAVGLIPVAMGLAAIFTFLITRPLRQVDQAMRRLGAGDFAAQIRVTGPRDLEELGMRLEWLRKRLMELETQKISVLRHISHELKTPLTAIREGTELLGDGVVGPLTGDQAEIAQILRDNSLLLQKRIEDLLSFSVARTPRQPLEAEPVPLDQLMEQVLAHQRLVIKGKRLEVRAALAPISVSGDPDQLRIILDNLLSNAVKYSPARGKIGIDLGPDQGKAVLDMHDEGPGIAPQDRDRVFEAFYQGGIGDAGHVKGTGLGLAIAQELAKLYDGQIEIIDSPGGTHMRLTLPTGSSQ